MNTIIALENVKVADSAPELPSGSKPASLPAHFPQAIAAGKEPTPSGTLSEKRK
jgi:hypothetical protein